MDIGVIGTGTIASAVVAGLAGQGHRITVSERSADRAADLARRFDEVSVADNQSVLEQSDIVILGLMVAQAPAILSRLTFRSDHKVISMMAGASRDDVAGMVAPAVAEAVMMPFPAVAEGGSAIMALGGAALLDDLFGGRNTVFQLRDDQELASYLCAQAVLSPAVKLVADAAGWLGGRVSDPAQGEAFLRFLVGSSLQGAECAPLLAALNTPGGFNQRLRAHMDASSMSGDLVDGLDHLEGGQ